MNAILSRRSRALRRAAPALLAIALLALFFSQLVSLNTQVLPGQDPTLKLQCLLVNDEFAALGRVGIITTSASFLAGYNLRLLTVVHAMSQLDARSQAVLRARWMTDQKATLHELADQYGVSAERIRQIEANAIKKLRKLVVAEEA